MHVVYAFQFYNRSILVFAFFNTLPLEVTVAEDSDDEFAYEEVRL